MDVVRQANTYFLQVPISELESVRAVPHRAFDPKRKIWRVPVTPNACKALGLPFEGFAPIPLPENFGYKTYPWIKHQLEVLEAGLGIDSYGLFLAPGLGKTRILIDDTVWASTRGIQGAAIVCPNSIKSNWMEEIEKHSIIENDIWVYSPGKKAATERWLRGPHQGFPWFIIAVESLSSGEGKRFLEAFLRSRKASLIDDESSRIKSHKAERTKVMLGMGSLAIRKRIATGTPFLKGLQDTWSQFTFLDPAILNHLNYYAFRNKFCVLGGFNGKVIVGNVNQEEYMDLTSHYVSVRSKDVLGLPPKVYHVRRITPSDEQKRVYTQLKKDGEVELDGGRLYFQNVLVRDLRLQQVCGGFACVDTTPVVSDDFDTVLAKLQSPSGTLQDVQELLQDALPKTKMVALPNPKLTELVAIAEEYPGKMIVWCRFRAEIDAIAVELSTYGKVVVFHGDCTDDERTAARQSFQSGDARFFVAQEQTGGIGITLTAAQTTVYFSNSWSLEDRIQSEDRNHRVGTTGTVVYIDLLMEGSWVDSRVHAALKSGRNYVDLLMEEMKSSGKILPNTP